MKGSPRLSDFGLCSVTRNIDSVNASTPNRGCTVRYCAPELLDLKDTGNVEKKKLTNKTDVYSLSMVVVEVHTFPKLCMPRFLLSSLPARDRKDALYRNSGLHCHRYGLEGQATVEASPFCSPGNDPSGLEDCPEVLE